MYQSLPEVSSPARFLGLAYAQRLSAAPRLLRYSLAAAFFLIALAARFELVDVLPAKGFPFLTFFPAVLLAAYLAGLGPGLLTSALSVLAACFFFIQPDRSLPLTGPDLVALAFFSVILLINCVVIHVMKTASGRVSRTEQQLRHSSQRLQLVLNNLNMYVGVLDLGGILHEVNEEPLRVTGLRKEDIVGRPLWEAPWWAGNVDRQNEVRAAIGRAAAGETVRFDIEAQRSGQKFTIDFQVGPWPRCSRVVKMRSLPPKLRKQSGACWMPPSMPCPPGSSWPMRTANCCA
jgi:PAS domain S-box-containing protein